MKNFTKTTLSLVAVLLLSLAFVQCKDAKDAVVTKALELQAEQINKQCPISLGNGITMDKCSIEDGKTLKTSFTVPNGTPIDDSGKANVVESIKSAPDLKQLRELDVTFIYAYYDADKKLVAEIKVTPEDYK